MCDRLLRLHRPHSKATESPLLGDPDVSSAERASSLVQDFFDSMKKTVDAIKEAGLRDDVKIMIGGGQMDEQVRDFAGADAFGKDAMEAVKLAQGWIGG